MKIKIDSDVTHFSMDIETLGTGKNAVITAIGFSRMNRLIKGPFNSLYLPLRFMSQLSARRGVDEETIRWWMRQEDTARHNTFPPSDQCYTEADAVSLIDKFLQNSVIENKIAIWTKGPAFDGAIFESMCETLGLRCPVNYRWWQDVRTIELLTGKKVPAITGAHHALYDAQGQGNFVAEALGL